MAPLDLLLALVKFLLLLGLAELGVHEILLQNLGSLEQHTDEWRGHASSQERYVGPAYRKSCILVLADEASSIKCKHEICKGNDHHIKEDLQFIQMGVEEWALLRWSARDLDNYHGCEADGAKLNDPLVAHHYDSKDKNELSSKFCSREVDRHFPLGILPIAYHTIVYLSPRLPKVFVDHQFVVVHAVEDHD